MNTPLLTSTIKVCRTENADTYSQSDSEAVREAAADDFQASGTQHARLPVTGQDRVTRYAWYVIFLLFLVNVFNYMDQTALSVLAPSMKADLQLSDAQIGLLTGLAFGVFYAICGIPIARWADRGNRRNIIALALTTWSVMTVLSGAAQCFWHLLIARAGIAAGEAGGVGPAQSLICDYVPPKQRPGVFAIHGFGFFVGMVLGLVLSGWLGDIIGWRWTFVMLGLPGIAFAVVVRVALREPARGRFDAVQDDKTGTSLGGAMTVLWHCKTYRLILLYAVALGFVNMGFYQWLPSFYARTQGLSLSSVGVSLGMTIGFGSGIGLLTGGLLANKLSQRDVRLPLLIGVGAFSITLFTALGILFVSSAVGSLILLLLTVLLWNLPAGAVVASLYSVTIPRMRATAGAVSGFATSVLGMGLGPFCVGLLSDLLTPSFGIAALRYALLVPICFIPVMAITLYAASKTLPADLRTVGALVDGPPRSQQQPESQPRMD